MIHAEIIGAQVFQEFPLHDRSFIVGEKWTAIKPREGCSNGRLGNPIAIHQDGGHIDPFSPSFPRGQGQLLMSKKSLFDEQMIGLDCTRASSWRNCLV